MGKVVIFPGCGAALDLLIWYIGYHKEGILPPCGLHPHPFKVASPVPWCNLRKIGIVSRLDCMAASWYILHYVARKCIINILLPVVKVPVGRVAAISIQKAVRKLHCTKLKARVLYSLSPAKVLLPMSHPSSATSWICRSPSGLLLFPCSSINAVCRNKGM